MTETISPKEKALSASTYTWYVSLSTLVDPDFITACREAAEQGNDEALNQALSKISPREDIAELYEQHTDSNKAEPYRWISLNLDLIVEQHPEISQTDNNQERRFGSQRKDTPLYVSAILKQLKVDSVFNNRTVHGQVPSGVPVISNNPDTLNKAEETGGGAFTAGDESLHNILDSMMSQKAESHYQERVVAFGLNKLPSSRIKNLFKPIASVCSGLREHFRKHGGPPSAPHGKTKPAMQTVEL